MRLSGAAPSLRHHTAPQTETPWRDPAHVVVETCVEDVEGVRLSARAGADRAELCDNLAVGGTTPSIGTVEAAIFAAAEEVAHRRAVTGPRWAERPEGAPFGLRVMIRPRGGGFIFTSDERRSMIADVRRIAALSREMSEYTRPQRLGRHGRALPPAVDLGFVMGALTEDRTVDRGLLRLLIDTADGAPVTFHRAIDTCRDLVEAYGDLGGIGVDYVLTAGGAPTAAQGAEILRGMVEAGEPRVIAAGAVRPDSLAAVIEASGAREVHMRCTAPGTTLAEPQRTDEAQVRRAVEAARRLTPPPVPRRDRDK
ncbi:MAG: copper homeostasis protein CutC [Actinomyces sp.]|uniref:copper homeostasis protein CutC n=1 Tax=Actinomyces sp. TaxID=29317 RepID=UPI0026DCC2F2|nr:copper homeostasis protein CutC [Actinomyces sp.]MDO4243075.1 copper homeostasis protein CutC [Actinomyces sp.]